MSEPLSMENSDRLGEEKWSPMVVLSIIFHLAVFSFIFFVPEPTPARHIKGVVYEVNLVEMPSGGGPTLQETGPATRKKGKVIIKKDAQAKPIPIAKKKKKSLVIAKRTVEKKKSVKKKPTVSPSQLIDRAISKIEAKVKSDRKGHIDKAISKLERDVRTRYGSGSGSPGGQAGSGISIRIYQMEVERRIKENWSYPVALHNPKDRKDLEAIVLVKVKSNGAIIKSWFEKRSANTIFDRSVLRAIERSDPLPPFPEGYRKSYDEIEINFNLKDLESQ